MLFNVKILCLMSPLWVQKGLREKCCFEYYTVKLLLLLHVISIKNLQFVKLQIFKAYSDYISLIEILFMTLNSQSTWYLNTNSICVSIYEQTNEFENFVCFNSIALPHMFSILKVTLNIQLTLS